MLCVGDESNDQSASDFTSLPPKIQRVSIEDTSASKEKLVHQSSGEHNLGPLFSDDNAQVGVA